ncbi:MAG: HypC/HybG/HupF family hydrogenase formation chaperone, partial [Acetobacter papayae]
MCVGIPMTVQSVEGTFALCAARLPDGALATPQRVDMALVPEARTGDDVLVFLGLARAQLSAQEAARIRAALESVAALSVAEEGASAEIIARGFADLCEPAPRRPRAGLPISAPA